MEVLEIVISIIGIILPIIAEMLKSKKNKNKENSLTIVGNNNLIHQSNETKMVTVTNNNYYYGVTADKSRNIFFSCSLCISLCISGLLGFCFKFSTSILLIYVILYAFQMFISYFSPQKRKYSIGLYIINFIMTILVMLSFNQKLWTSEMITLYSIFSDEFAIELLWEYVLSGISYTIYGFLLLLLFQVLACGSALCQCFLHIHNIIICRIKGVTSKTLKDINFDCIIVNICPLVVLFGSLSFIILDYFI